MTTVRPRRVYRSKSERTPSAAKAMIAAARPRDARGHFLPTVDGAVRPATFIGGEATGPVDFVA